jgi:hypothetical protein
MIKPLLPALRSARPINRMLARVLEAISLSRELQTLRVCELRHDGESTGNELVAHSQIPVDVDDIVLLSRQREVIEIITDVTASAREETGRGAGQARIV